MCLNPDRSNFKVGDYAEVNVRGLLAADLDTPAQVRWNGNSRGVIVPNLQYNWTGDGIHKCYGRHGVQAICKSTVLLRPFVRGV